MEGNICINQTYKETNPKLFDIMIINLFFKQRVENEFMESSFCSR